MNISDWASLVQLCLIIATEDKIIENADYFWARPTGVSETSQLRILHLAEEDNLSPIDSKIACLCQGIEINNNKHVYCQSQGRKPIGSEVKWAECSLIIGTGCWIQV